ncbi:MAG: hypothetical protein H7331_12435 [Bacteroidia bacterium]|nr:hypothetical protein [Bacteroidia bacterium]
MIILATKSFAQTNANWKRNGDALNAGDFIGSTNAEPLLLKSNNNLGLKINTNGFVLLKSLDLNSTIINGLVLTDGQGKLSRQNFNTSTSQYLASNGTWQAMPTQPWSVGLGNDIYKPTGNVGIGLQPSPFYKLDVLGDARISNNLYVGGGIIITDKVNAATEIKGENILVNNDFEVQNNSRFNGPSFFVGETNFNNTIRFNASAQFNTIAGFNAGLSASTINLIGSLKDGSGKTLLATSTINGQRHIGVGGAPIAIPSTVSCATPALSVPTNYQFAGNIQMYGNSNWGTTDLNVLTMGFDGANGIIDMAGTSTTSPNIAPRLLINYYCGKDVVIGNGAAGDLTATRDFFVGRKAQIGTQTQKTGIHTDALLTVNGKVVAKSFYVSITDWADYVFEPNYKLPNLYDVETYYKANKHLPEIPSECEVLEQGIDVAEMNKLLLKKIEEITLHVVRLQKEVDNLKIK